MPESSNPVNSLDPGLRQYDEGLKKYLEYDGRSLGGSRLGFDSSCLHRNTRIFPSASFISASLGSLAS